MSPSEPDSSLDPTEPPGQGLAIAAESLYLVNLLLLPVLGFLALVFLYFKRKDDAPPLAAHHLRQTVYASFWGGILLVFINIAILALGGYGGPYTWTVVITYFTIVHSTFVMLGILGLAKAMAGQEFRYPLVGPKS